MLKIISGKYRGHKINFDFRETTRPTSSLVKESLFNVLQYDVLDSNFLDLFCGSGQIGLEALSRGARHVTFVDYSKYCKDCLLSNLKKLNIDDDFDVVNQKAELYLARCKQKFDIVFLDPPYNMGLSEKILCLIVKNIKKDGIIVVETEKNEILGDSYGSLHIDKEYVYGKKKITVYRNISLHENSSFAGKF